MSQAKRIAVEKLETLEQLERTRPSNYVWTKDELRRVAPEYHGSANKFSLSIYITKFKQRTTELQEKRASTTSRNPMRNIDDELPDLGSAVRMLFHAACPHPIRYRDSEGEIDFEEYQTDLGIWLTTISTTWIQMQATEHESDCTCCISFRLLATNYEHMLKGVMTDHEYEVKRVAKNTIRRWAVGLDSDSAKEALNSLIEIGKAILKNEQSSFISELTDKSSNIPDELSEEEGELSVETEAKFGERLYDTQCEEKPDIEHLTPIKMLRRRQSIARPIDTISEISDVKGMLELAVPEVEIAVQIYIPLGQYNHVGRNELCEYAKTFLRQLIKVKQKLTILELGGKQLQKRRIDKMYKAYENTRYTLTRLLNGEQSVYTTRSRKRTRARMLNL